MSIAHEKLVAAQDQLSRALGEDLMKIYLANLKQWFRKVWTKEQFDFECRKLLTLEQCNLHNEFFLAILNKITFQMHSPQSKASGKKRKRKAGSERATFEPAELFDLLPEENEDIRPPSTPLHQPRFAVEELFLPDSSLILGRLLVVAWETGLSNADEDICDMLVIAVQVLLKNILSAIIKSRKNYRTANSGLFYYDVGFEDKNPYLRNSATRQIVDDHPFDVDREVSSTSLLHRTNDDDFFLSANEDSQQPAVSGRIKMIDLYNALQDKNLIPCHSVYSNNMARISQMLH